MPKPKSLSLISSAPEAVVDPELGRDHSTNRYSGEECTNGPRTSANYTLLMAEKKLQYAYRCCLKRTFRVHHARAIIWGIPIRHPFPYVPQHVIQSKGHLVALVPPHALYRHCSQSTKRSGQAVRSEYPDCHRVPHIRTQLQSAISFLHAGNKRFVVPRNALNRQLVAFEVRWDYCLSPSYMPPASLESVPIQKPLLI